MRSGAREGEVNFEGKYYRVEQAKLATPFVAPDRKAPEIYVSGHSEQSEQLAYSQGTCWLRVAESPAKLEADRCAHASSAELEFVCGCCLLCRPTREEAIEVARVCCRKMRKKARRR
jgi:alkanesulfonate monooxygenase SsuD/methylene tetrahydromethanopterin reductase-like flavin-dependent oxidoreductase (luciferase family)